MSKIFSVKGNESTTLLLIAKETISRLVERINKYFVPTFITPSINLILREEKISNTLKLIILTDYSNLELYENEEEAARILLKYTDYVDNIQQKVKIINVNSNEFKCFSLNNVNNQIEVEIFEKERDNSHYENHIEAIYSIQNSQKSKSTEIFIQNFIIYLKKIHLFNFHLTINFYFHESILELNNFSLVKCGIDADVFIEYLKRQLNCVIYQDSYFFLDYDSMNKFKIELMVVFHSTDEYNYFFDFISAYNNIYSYRNENLLENLINDQEFIFILNKYFHIFITDKTDLNRILIKNENKKSLMFILNVVNSNISIEDLDFFAVKQIVFEIKKILIQIHLRIKQKNMFLLLDEKDRKILQIYERDMNIISRSLVEVYHNVT